MSFLAISQNYGPLLNFVLSSVTKTSFMSEMIDHNFSPLRRQCSLEGEGKVRIRF